MAADWKCAEWYQHFSVSFESQQREIQSLSSVMELYEKLRRENLAYGRQHAKAARTIPSPVVGDVNRMDQALLQKSKQIESQQSLLNDLQAQLSSKESEVRDYSRQLNTSIAQATQLRAQLEATHALLQEKEMEVIRLRDEANRNHIEFIQESVEESMKELAPTISSHLIVPSRVVVSHQLSTSSTEPGFIATTRSGSGPMIVTVGSNKLHSFNGVSGSVVSESNVIGASLLCGAISPENDTVLVGSSESQLSLVDLNGRILKDLKGHSGKVKGCGFVGSRTKAFSVATDRTIKLWDLSRACPFRSVPVTSQLVGGVATSDGTMIVTCHLNGKIAVWSMQEKICEIDAHQDTCLGVSLSPDGRFITSVGKDDSVSVIDLHMAQTGPIHKLKGFKALATDNAPSCSLDSRIVSVSAGNGIHSWDLILGSPLSVIHTDAIGLTWTLGSPAESKPTNQIVSIHKQGIVKWWVP